MKYLKLIALTTTLVLSQFGHSAQGVYGNWKLPLYTSGPLTIESYISIAAGTITAHSKCSVSGQSASVEASSPAAVTATDISVLAPSQNSITVNGVNCTANIAASVIGYVVSPDDTTLTLSMPGQGSMTFPRQ